MPPFLHRPSSKGTKLLFQVIKAIINETKNQPFTHACAQTYADPGASPQHPACRHALYHARPRRPQRLLVLLVVALRDPRRLCGDNTALLEQRFELLTLLLSVAQPHSHHFNGKKAFQCCLPVNQVYYVMLRFQQGML